MTGTVILLHCRGRQRAGRQEKRNAIPDHRADRFPLPGRRISGQYLPERCDRENEAGAKTTFGAPLKAPKRCYVFMLKSSDGGKTWSEPKDITNMILNEEDGTFLGVAPGVGVTTKDGRVIMPLYSTKGRRVYLQH